MGVFSFLCEAGVKLAVGGLEGPMEVWSRPALRTRRARRDADVEPRADRADVGKDVLIERLFGDGSLAALASAWGLFEMLVVEPESH